MVNENDGKDLLERMKIALCSSSYKDLAQQLGVSRAILGTCRKEGVLQPALRDALRRRGINPAWVEREEGPRSLAPALCGSYRCRQSLQRLVDSAVRSFVLTWPRDTQDPLH